MPNKKIFIALFLVALMIGSSFAILTESSLGGEHVDLGMNTISSKDNRTSQTPEHIGLNNNPHLQEKSSINGPNTLHIESAISMTSDSMGNLFVLWNNGNVFERSDMGGSNWIFLGNAEGIGSYNNKSIDLGNPVGIRASYNWENTIGTDVGMIMVLFSNGFASYTYYGINPIVWKLSKLPSGNDYVSLSYNLADFSYIGVHNQVFYASQRDGVTYGYSDRYYSWTPVIKTQINTNLTATLAWSNNFSPPATGTVIMLGITKNGDVYFAEGSTNPLAKLSWKAEGKISAINPDFISLAQTPNPSSSFYYYAIEGQKNSTLFASFDFNGTAASFIPIGHTKTTHNQTALQNKYFGFQSKSDELILLRNGDICQTKNEGKSYELFSIVPMKSHERSTLNVMPWIYQSGNLKQSLQELNQTHDNYTMISYEFYELQPDEEITPFDGYTNPSNPANITRLIHKYDLGAVPMIVSASAKLIYMFTSNSYVETLEINQMAKYAVMYNYTGYDIDWEPASSNKTTGLLFDHFLNKFSLTLNKFGRSLFVEVAGWDPGFWNFSNLGRTNVTSINIMDYNGVFSGMSSSFLCLLQRGVSNIPSGKLSISLENTNPLTDCVDNFTAKQMSERLHAIEQDNIKFIGIWVMPFNISLVSQIQDYLLNHTRATYDCSYSLGASGISVSNTGNATSGKISFNYYKGSYLYGDGNYSTYFYPGTILNEICYNYSGSNPVYLYVEYNNCWHFFKKVSSSPENKLTLPTNTANIRFLFGNFSGFVAYSSYAAKLNYTLTYKKILNFGWLNLYYQKGSNVYINGIKAENVKITTFGQYDGANITLPVGHYNISIERYQFSGYFDHINVRKEHVSFVYGEVQTLLGTIEAVINPHSAVIKIDGTPIRTIAGKFKYIAVEGTYILTVEKAFYNSKTENVTIRSGSITNIFLNLSYSKPSSVVLKIPAKITKPTFDIIWSKFAGIDFNNYSVYISTNKSLLGNVVYVTMIVNQTTYTIANLSYSTTYYVTVFTYAQNAVSQSNIVNFTTPANNQVVPPEKATSVFPYEIGIMAASIVAALAIVDLVYTRMRVKKK